MRLLPLVLVLMLPAPPAVAAEPIGRLFYTPDQRASLDGARSKRARNMTATEKEAPPPPPPSPEVVTYGGMVRRSDGKTTVWLNDHAVGEKEARSRIVGKVRPDGSVTLQSPQTGRNVELRIGQRAELLSGRVEEGYRHAPAQKPEVKPVDPAVTKAETAAAEAERKKEERERQENLDDAVRALRDAAQAKAAAAPQPAPAPAPLQQSGTPPAMVVPAPGQLPAK